MIDPMRVMIDEMNEKIAYYAAHPEEIPEPTPPVNPTQFIGTRVCIDDTTLTKTGEHVQFKAQITEEKRTFNLVINSYDKHGKMMFKLISAGRRYANVIGKILSHEEITHNGHTTVNITLLSSRTEWI